MMMNQVRPPSAGSLVVLRIFIITLGIWLGAGCYSALGSSAAWFADPVSWARGEPPPRAGSINPWPLLTILLTLSTLAATALFALYRGPGRNEVRVALGGTLLILTITFIYFVPRLGLIFGQAEALTDAQLFAHSRQWIVLNALRLVMLAALFYVALIALTRMGRRS